MNLAHIRLEDVKKIKEEEKSLPQTAEEVVEKPKSKYKVVKLLEEESEETE